MMIQVFKSKKNLVGMIIIELMFFSFCFFILKEGIFKSISAALVLLPAYSLYLKIVALLKEEKIKLEIPELIRLERLSLLITTPLFACYYYLFYGENYIAAIVASVVYVITDVLLRMIRIRKQY